MSCSNNGSTAPPITGGSRRIQYGDRRKSRKGRKHRGGMWPFSNSSLSSGLESEKKGWFSSLFSSDSNAAAPSSILSPAPAPASAPSSFSTPSAFSGGKSRRRRRAAKKSRGGRSKSHSRSRRHRRK
jgi:hypothetical protein